jgi:uncharacterized membrane protein YhaH (DUF805 family)
MTPIAWAVRPFKRYADFRGRSPRAEYWWFVLFQWLALMALVFLAVAVAGPSKESNPFFGAFIVPFVIGFVGLIIPNIAVQVRRLHDQDRSGWFILLFVIPYVGGLIAIAFMCIPGTRGPNRFGADPYGSEDGYLEEVFA